MTLPKFDKVNRTVQIIVEDIFHVCSMFNQRQNLFYDTQGYIPVFHGYMPILGLQNVGTRIFPNLKNFEFPNCIRYFKPLQL